MNEMQKVGLGFGAVGLCWAFEEWMWGSDPRFTYQDLVTAIAEYLSVDDRAFDFLPLAWRVSWGCEVQS